MTDKFNDAEYLRLAIFMIVMNNILMSKDEILYESMDEVIKMSYGMILTLIEGDVLNLELANELYQKGKKLYEEDKK